MARNVFGFGPMGVAPDLAPQDPKSTADALASRHQVPANVLLALQEAGSADLDRDAADLATTLKSGATLDQALGAKIGDPARASAVLNRAYDIADELYPRPEAKREPSMLRDTAAGAGGALVRGVGYAADFGARLAGDFLGAPDAGAIAGQIVGDPIKQAGDAVSGLVSPEAREAAQKVLPTGDLLDPSTWAAPEEITIRGAIQIAAEGLGSMAPVVLAGLVAGPGGAAAAGGAMSGGAGRETAAQTIDGLWEPDEAGNRPLEQSEVFQGLVAQGMTPQAAYRTIRDRAAKIGGDLSAVVGGIGGAATQKLVGGIAGGKYAASRAVRGILASATEEGIQEGIEGVAARKGAQDASGVDMSLTENFISDAAAGALGGGPFGALAGLSRPQNPSGDGSSGGQAAAPNPPTPGGGVAADQIDPVGAAPAPTGPLSRAAAAAPDLTPPPEMPEQPPKFPDQKPGKPIRVADPQGRIWDAVFQRETPEGGAVLRIAGEEITLDAVEFDGAVLNARLADDEAKMKAKGKTVPEQAPTATPEDLARPPMQPGGLAAQAQAGIAPPAPAPAQEPDPTPAAPLEVTQAPTPDRAPWWDGADDLTRKTILKASGLSPRLAVARPFSEMPVKARKALTDAFGQLYRDGKIDNIGTIEEPRFALRGETIEATAVPPPKGAPDAAQTPTETTGAGAAPPADDAGGAGPAGTVQGVQPDRGQTDAQPDVEGGQARPGPDGEAGAGDVAQPVNQAALTEEAAKDAPYQPGERVSVFYKGGPRKGWNRGVVSELGETTQDGARFISVLLDDGAQTTGVTPDRVVRGDPPALGETEGQSPTDSDTGALEPGATTPQPGEAPVSSAPAPDPVTAAAAETDPDPTPAQVEAENYKTGKVAWNGLTLSIENAKGSIRRKVTPDGETAWEVVMPAHYGRILGTTGADGDHVDFYMGPHPESDQVWVVDQRDPDTGRFDEIKVILGSLNVLDAFGIYTKGFSDGRGEERAAAISETSVDGIKQFLRSRDATGSFAGAKGASWSVSSPTLQGLGERAGQVPQSSQPPLSQLRGPGDNGAPQTDELPSLSGRGGRPPNAVAPTGPDQQRQGVRAGQPSLADEEGAGAKYEKEPPSDAQRGDETDGRVGGADEPGPINDPLPAKPGDERSGSDLDAGKGKRTEAVSPAPRPDANAFAAAIGDKANRTMKLDGLDFDAWDNKTREDGQMSPAKRQGRDETGRWAKALVKALTDAGRFTPSLDKKGKPVKAVAFGYGMASELDETNIHLTAPNGLELYVSMRNPISRGKKLALLVQFTGEPPKKGYSRPFIGGNEYLDEGMTPAEAAAQIARWAEQRTPREKADAAPPAAAPAPVEPQPEPPQQEQTPAPVPEAAVEAPAGGELGEGTTGGAVPTKGLANLSDAENAELAALEAEFLDLMKTQISSGLDPKMVAVAFKIGTLYVKAGTRRFRGMIDTMMQRLGLTLEQAQPYARNAYNQIRDDLELAGEDVRDMDTAAEVVTEIRKMRAASAKATEGANGSTAESEGATLEAPAPVSGGTNTETGDDAGRDGGRGDAGLDNGTPGEGGAVGPGGPDAGGNGGRGDGDGRGDEPKDPGTGGPDGDAGNLSIPAAPPGDGQGLTRSGVSPGNFEITDDFRLGEGTPKQKIDGNLAAIRLVKDLDRLNRYPTRDEQAVLARYVGWGGLKGVFDGKNSGKTDMWGRAQADLKELLTPDEYQNALFSVSNAHYTAKPVVDAMWRAMRHFGFEGGRALEPTVGTGNFLGAQPQDLAAKTEWFASELDPVTSSIAAYLYPEATVLRATGFEKAPFRDGAFDIAIGNPPFGAETIRDKDRPDISGLSLHNYIIAKTGKHLRPGGVMAMVVTHRFLDTPNPETRNVLAKQFRFMGAVRLPSDAFLKNAGTEVTTDIVFFQKLGEGEKRDLDAAWLDTSAMLPLEGPGFARVNRYFFNNPQNILGRSAMDGTMYGAAATDGEYTVHSDGRDLSAAIDEAVQKSMAADANTLGNRAHALEAAIAAEDTSGLPIGGMQMLPNGSIIRREMDRGISEITADSHWSEGAEEWDRLTKALSALRDMLRKGTASPAEFMETQDAFFAAKEVAYRKGGRRAASPTKAEQAVYDIEDGLRRGDGAWEFDAQLAEVKKTSDNRKLGDTRFARLKGLLELRRQTQALIRAEFADASNIEDMRTTLNKAYDAFVAEHGFVNAGANVSVLRGDTGAELGLEAEYSEALKETVNGKTTVIEPEMAKKSRILSARVNRPKKDISAASSPEDALLVSMQERGRVDLGYMAALLQAKGMGPEAIRDALSMGDEPRIYFDPEKDEWTDAERYLSGNIKDKLDAAKRAGLTVNMRALEKAMPAPLTRERIVPAIRSQWIPTEVFEAFLKDLGIDRPQVNIISKAGMVTVEGMARQMPTDYGRQFQHSRADILKIFTAAVNGKSLTIYDSIDKKLVKNEEATKEVNAIMSRMGKEFQAWAYSDAERADAIVKAFNEKVNVFRRRTYDGERYLRPVGANTGPGGFQLRRTQKNGAWRLIQEDRVLLDHVVGAGKTLTVVQGVMERRRLGLTRKALLAVPNHLVLQWAREWLQFYPGARLLAATKDDFEGPNRRRLFARMATGDYDAIIIGHSSLGFIAPPQQDVVDLMTSQVSDMQDALDQAKRDGTSKRTMNQLATKLKKYRERLQTLLEKPRDTLGFDLAEMGVDYLGVDEAHEFKNLEYATGAERLVGMNDPNGSKRAFDLLVKVRGIQKRGGATHFATGTPVSNSLVEAYAMMKYLAWEEMEKLGVSNFDAWSAYFVQAETRFEYTATQKLKERNVMSGLVNLGPLADLYRGFADVIDRQDLERIYAEQIREQNIERKAKGLPLLSERFPTPHVKDGGRRLLSAPPSSMQELATDYYVARMAAIKKNASNKEYASIDNPLWVLSDARKSSLDIRLLKAAAGQPRAENSKVSRSAREIKRIYDKWSSVKGTQLVFSDLSTPSKAAEKEAAKTIRDLVGLMSGAEEAKAKMKAMAGKAYTDQWAEAVEAATAALDDPLTDDDVRERIEAFFAANEDAEGVMMTADTGFSVYDDLRAALVESGIPEREIAFIHDYDTPAAKAKLFKKVNAGAIRVLLGSTPKMGAGTNVQERVVALHHIDSPWRPSDVEQREGRVIRQGNKLYEADPDGFEVEILAYSTTGTSDVVLWQVLERKARSIGMFKAGAVDRLDEGDGDADSYAEFMATSTGNPVFRLKMQTEKALLEEGSKISGALLAKSSAQAFLRGFSRSKEDLEAALARFEKMQPTALDYQGIGGSADELTAALDRAQAKYEAANERFDAFRAKVEARKIELAATGLSEGKVRYAITKEFGDEAKENQRPAKPDALTDEVVAASGYARAIKRMLADVDATVSDGQRTARLPDGTEITINHAHRTSVKHERLLQITYRPAGQPNPRFIDSTYAINASGSPRLISSLMPRGISSMRKFWIEDTTRRITTMDAAKPDQERLSLLDVDTTAREEIRDTLDFYALEVKLAEAKADVDRANRGANIFIMSDTARPLDEMGSVAVNAAPTFAIDGDVFTGTGLGARMREIGESPALFEVTSEKTGQRALVVAKKEGTGWVSERLVKPTPRAVREMAAAKESRFGRAASNTITGQDIRPLTTALTTEMRRHGLAGRITPVLVRNLINEAGIPIAGRQQGATITVSAESGDVTGVMRHEIIHVLRDARLWDKPYGLFAEAEWKALVRAARSDKALMQRVDAAYPDLPTAAKTEEAVAEMYRQWAAGREIEGPVVRILGKIRRFLRAMAAALRGVGFTDAALVMERISRGEVGGRGPDGPQGPGGMPKDARAPAATAEPKEMRLDLLRGRTKAIVGQQWKKTEGSYWSDLLTTAMAGSGGWNTLALVPGRALFAELGKNLLAAKAYLRGKEEMDALRNQWHARADETAQEWMTLRRKDSAANDELMDLMHQTTLDGIDPSKPDTWQHAMAGPAERNIERLGDKADQWAIDTMKQVRQRRATYATLKERFDAMPKPFQAMYRKVRSEYDAIATDFEKAVIENIATGMEIATKRAERTYLREMERIRDEGLEGDEKKAAEATAKEKLDATKQRGGWAGKARMAALRQSFESNRLKGPYFPLARFGEFFVTERDSKGAVVSFSRFETAREQRDYAAEAEARNPGRVQTGVMSNKDELKGSVDPRFVADVEAMLSEAGAGPDVMDAVWQRWLETLPDRSIRNSRIHRKGREGFSKDAFRAFGKHMFHGAHQLAKLKFGLTLEEHLNDAEDEARRADDPSRAGLVVNEMRRRHDFTMNPTGSAAVASLSSLAFIWYLGATPAAAIANISQTTVVGIPVMAARFQKAGVTGAVRALTRAARDFAQGRGSIENAKDLTADEVLAIKEALRRGTIDKTQAHDLASVAETGIEYNAAREKVMRLIGFMFHHAERFNREVTFMASYRLARAEGMSHADAIDAGTDVTWKSHYDYSNTSRPRIMQSDLGKILTMFRNFTVNTLWRLFRDTHQALTGATAEERREARTQLIGITLSMFAHAGIKGVWGYGLLMMFLGIFFPGGSDEAEEKLQDALLLEGDGPGTAAWNWIMGAALSGIPGHVTGTDLTERIGMPNLWFRGVNRDLEGEDLYAHYVGEVLGPVFGIGEGIFRGVSMMADGEVWRGTEAAIPKVVRDLMKSYRFATEGAETMKGDPIIEEMSPYQIILQMNGFTPAQLAERYEINNRLKNEEARIMDERKSIHRAVGDNLRAGEPVSETLLDRIRDFNARFPEYPITPATIKQSVQGQIRASDRNEYGIQLNPRLNDRLRAEQPPPVYN